MFNFRRLSRWRRRKKEEKSEGGAFIRHLRLHRLELTILPLSGLNLIAEEVIQLQEYVGMVLRSSGMSETRRVAS